MTKISKDKLEFYDKHGFVRLENGLSDELLKRLRDLSAKLEELAKHEFSKGEVSSQYCMSVESGEPRLFRYNDLLYDAPELVIELLATPCMMAVCHQLCGIGCVPMELDLLYKYPHPHPHVAWHQGAMHPRNYPYLNVGIYLDDADIDDGCLRYVPNTQHQLQDIYQLSSVHGWEIPGVVQQNAKAGDILVQDMMILHSSEPKRSPGVRRTIYVELRPMAGIEESKAQSNEWAELRKQWMAHVIAAASEADVPEGWAEFYGKPQVELKELVEKIKQREEPPIPAVWAPRPVAHPDYPTRADLR